VARPQDAVPPSQPAEEDSWPRAVSADSMAVGSSSLFDLVVPPTVSPPLRAANPNPIRPEAVGLCRQDTPAQLWLTAQPHPSAGWSPRARR
jgi:hypothetical protein